MKLPLTESLVTKPHSHPATRESSRECRYDIYDAKQPGLIARVYPSGTVTFWCQWKRGRRTKLGVAGNISVKEARAECITALERKDAYQATKAELERLESPPEPPEAESDTGAAITLGDFITDHYEKYFYRYHDKRSREMNNLARFDKSWLLSEIDKPRIGEWIDGRLDSGVKPQSVNREINSLKATLSYAVKREFIANNPLFGLQRLAEENSNRVRYLSDAERKRLMQALDKREERIRRTQKKASNLPFADYLKPMVVLSLHSGLRQGELFSIQWPDYTDGVLRVTSRKGRNGQPKVRYVPLSPTGIKTIETWRTQVDGDGFVFLSKYTGGRYDNVRNSWNAVTSKAKINDFRWHDMRHDYASRLVMAGQPLNDVRELLGHSDLSMTLRYAHLAPDHLKQTVQVLG